MERRLLLEREHLLVAICTASKNATPHYHLSAIGPTKVALPLPCYEKK